MHGACFRTAGSVAVNVEKDNEKKKQEQEMEEKEDEEEKEEEEEEKEEEASCSLTRRRRMVSKYPILCPARLYECWWAQAGNGRKTRPEKRGQGRRVGRRRHC
jgi:hypothetical protein